MIKELTRNVRNDDSRPSRQTFSRLTFPKFSGYALFSADFGSAIMPIPAHARAGQRFLSTNKTLGCDGPVELTYRAAGLRDQSTTPPQGLSRIWNVHQKKMVKKLTVNFVYRSSTFSSKLLKLQQLKTNLPTSATVTIMTIEGGGLADLVPQHWRKSIKDAAEIYGSISLALVMEAEADSELRQQMLGLYLFDNLRSYDQYLHSWGPPDWKSARKLCGLDLEDLSTLLSLSTQTIEAMEYAWVVPDFGVLLEYVTRLEWPLGVLYRNERDWHHLPTLWRAYRYRRGGAQ